MTSLAHSIPPSEAHDTLRDICPCCGGTVHRVQRRSFDRFVNFFMPVYRYRCGSLDCDWEGNLLVQQKSAQK